MLYGYDEPVEFSFMHNGLLNRGHYCMHNKGLDAYIEWYVRMGDVTGESEWLSTDKVQWSGFYQLVLKGVQNG